MSRSYMLLSSFSRKSGSTSDSPAFSSWSGSKERDEEQSEGGRGRGRGRERKRQREGEGERWREDESGGEETRDLVGEICHPISDESDVNAVLLGAIPHKKLAERRSALLYHPVLKEDERSGNEIS